MIGSAIYSIISDDVYSLKSTVNSHHTVERYAMYVSSLKQGEPIFFSFWIHENSPVRLVRRFWKCFSYFYIIRFADAADKCHTPMWSFISFILLFGLFFFSSRLIGWLTIFFVVVINVFYWWPESGFFLLFFFFFFNELNSNCIEKITRKLLESSQGKVSSIYVLFDSRAFFISPHHPFLILTFANIVWSMIASITPS